MALEFDIVFTRSTNSSLSTIFTFQTSPSVQPLLFPKTHRTNPSLSRRKRKRTTYSSKIVSGPIPKKRRLRHHLITSRLSHPYAVPTTHIANRRASSDNKIALWARYKHVSLGRALLCKAAILNCVQYSVARTIGSTPNMAAARCREMEMLRKKGVRMALLAEARGSLEAVNSTRPIAGGIRGHIGVRSPNMLALVSTVGDVGHSGVPPSPLGLSNYDALDAEEVRSSGECEERDDVGDDEVEPHGLDFGMAFAFVSDYDRLDDLEG